MDFGVFGMRTGHVTGHGHIGHGFHTAADGDLGPPGHDPQGGQGDRLQSGGTEAVDRGAGDSDREPGDLRGHATDVEPLFRLGERTADHHIIDVLGFDVAGFFHCRLQDKGQQVIGPGIFKGPLGSAATGGSDGRYDICVSHGRISFSFEVACRWSAYARPWLRFSPVSRNRRRPPFPG